MAIEDTVTINVTQQDPAPGSVVVSGPTEAKVGEIVSYSAIVYDQYGEPVPQAGVDWIVSPEGSAEVIASDAKAATIKPLVPGKINLTGRLAEEPAPGPDPDPNQWPPEGYTQLVPAVNFRDGWPEGWALKEVTQEGLATFTLEEGNPLPGGGTVARHTFLAGNGDGGATCYLISPKFTPSQEVIVEEVFRCSENFQSHQSGVNKSGYFANAGNPGGAAYWPLIWMTRGPNLLLSFGPQGHSDLSTRLTSDFSCERGKWYRARWRCILSPDATVGRYTIWGAELGQPLKMVGDWIKQSSVPEWDQLWDRVQIRPVWGGRGDEVKEDMFKEWAEIKVCGR